MVKLKAGDIVFSLAGHDKGRVYIVLDTEDGFVYIVDGKTKKLNKPKRKNLKHVKLGRDGTKELAGAVRAGNVTDSVIRKELAKFRSLTGTTRKGEAACQKMT